MDMLVARRVSVEWLRVLNEWFLFDAGSLNRKTVVLAELKELGIDVILEFQRSRAPISLSTVPSDLVQDREDDGVNCTIHAGWEKKTHMHPLENSKAMWQDTISFWLVYGGFLVLLPDGLQGWLRGPFLFLIPAKITPQQKAWSLPIWIMA